MLVNGKPKVTALEEMLANEEATIDARILRFSAPFGKNARLVSTLDLE